MYFSWSNFFIGLMGMGLGIWIIKDAFYLNHHVLFLGWVEQKWGPGMGTTGYRFIGLAITIFSMFVAIGQINLFGDGVTGTGGSTRSSTQNQTVIQSSSSRSPIAP